MLATKVGGTNTRARYVSRMMFSVSAKERWLIWIREVMIGTLDSSWRLNLSIFMEIWE